jgi:hypothetical protein
MSKPHGWTGYTGKDLTVGDLFTATIRYSPNAYYQDGSPATGQPAFKGHRLRVTKITEYCIETNIHRLAFSDFNFKRIGK